MKKVDVKKKQFRGIEKNPSLLGFGCMRFPTIEAEKPDIDEAKSEAMIDLAYNHGVTHFDTAYPYHNGLSEKFVGKVLKKYPRQTYTLATKMPGWMIESLDDVKRIFAEQLENLQTDYVDFYLCHALSKKSFEPYKLPGVMDFLFAMKKEGKIKRLGFSFHDTPEVLEEIVKTYPWDFVLLQINYLDWAFQDAKRQYEIACEHNLPIMVMEPVRGGALATLCEQSASLLKEANPEVSLASWAMRYVAELDQVMLILSGMSNKEQTLDNIHTLTDFEPLSKEEHTTLKQALEVFLNNNTVPCTACNYCVPCCEGVDIPYMIKIYNQYLLSEFKQGFLRAYNDAENKQAIQCIECGVCLEQCPQSIDIPKQMKTIESLVKKLESE